jgi:hypothetical protein
MAKRKTKRGSAKPRKPSARRSPAAAALAKGAFRPRVVKSKRAYSRKGATEAPEE